VPIRSLIDSEGFPAADSAILIAAFEDTLMVLGLVDRDDPATLLVAEHIITIAKAGERDPVKLRDLALKAVREWCDDSAPAPAPQGMNEGNLTAGAA